MNKAFPALRMERPALVESGGRNYNQLYKAFLRLKTSALTSRSFTKKHLTNPPIIIMLDNYKSKQINQTSKSCKQSNPIKHNGYEEEEYII